MYPLKSVYLILHGLDLGYRRPSDFDVGQTPTKGELLTIIFQVSDPSKNWQKPRKNFICGILQPEKHPEGQKNSTLQFEKLPSKRQRVPDIGKRFACAAGPHNDDRSVTQEAPQNTLDDINGFNFGMIHFECVAGNKSGLDHNALVRDGKLARPVSDERSDK